LLAAPLNTLILRALASGARQQAELRRSAGSPAQSTLRAQLKRLADIGAIEKRRRNRFPGVLEYELTPAGHSLLFVVDVLELWLAENPDGPLRLGESAARAAIKSLAESWSTTMLRALAARPLSLTDLDRVIPALSYPSLERRLASMRLAGHVQARRGDRRGTPYAITAWLRRGIAPLLAAIRWEREHQRAAAPLIAPLDIEAAFLLALPLLHLPEQVTGSCRMAAEIVNGQKSRLAGAVVQIEHGEVVSCSTQLNGRPDSWAVGSAMAWLDALVEHDIVRIEFGGDSRLARTGIDGLHRALFRPRDDSQLDVGCKISKDGLH